MWWIVGLVVFIAIINWLGNHPPLAWLLVLTASAAAIYALYKLILHSAWLNQPPKTEPLDIEAYLKEGGEQRKEKIRLEWEATDYQVPTRAQFLRDVYKDGGPLTQLFSSGTLPKWTGEGDWKVLPIEQVKQIYSEAVAKAHSSIIVVPEATRFAGTWIIAPPGRGKTNLLHHMVAVDRKQNATVMIMDSKGDLLNYYRGYEDVVIIDPDTVELNPLQLGTSTRTLDFLEYIFSALVETKLTPKQTTLFRSVLALMLKVPDATIETFRKVLVHGWKEYETAVMSLDETTRDFFYVPGRKSEFDGPQYSDTKQEVIQRLRLITSNDYLKQIFTSPKSNIDFFTLLDSGKTILINNSKDELGENGAEFVGRFFVAMVWMAAVSRSRLTPQQKVPVYFYIDECHTTVRRDTKITTILDECRSQKIALILAHQRIGQISTDVMDALNNCAIRIANSDDDAEALAKRFRVDASALRLPVGSFACFVRDQTSQARTVSVSEFDMSQFPPPKNTLVPQEQATHPVQTAVMKPASTPPEPVPDAPQPRKKGR